MKNILMFSFVLAVAVAAAGCSSMCKRHGSSSGEPAPRSDLWSPNDKKIIEYGWDMTAPSYVAEHIGEMEKKPFDGIIMDIRPVGEVFAAKNVDEAVLKKQMEALQLIKWDRFTDNFIIVFSRSEMDWFSDADWKWVLRNVGLVAKAARVGRCKGLVFDCEPYGADPWTYKTQKHTSTKTFAEYQAMVRMRGAQFMAAVQNNFPNPVIHTFYLLNLYAHPGRGAAAAERDPTEQQKKLEACFWNLYPAFVNGMLDAAGPETVITDGNEDSYYYSRAEQYYASYHTIHQTCLNLVDQRLWPKYMAQVQCAQALYVDYNFALQLNTTNLATGLTPEQRAKWFEHNAYYALKSSDRYVWLYSERMNWWQNKDIPPLLEDAVRSARDKATRNEPLGFDLDKVLAAPRAK